MKVFVILGFLVIYPFSQMIVPLNVKERAGIARTSEPITMGIPLPEGLSYDTSDFALKDGSGNVIPCEFRTASKWWSDKSSIRWLHVDFKASVTANETKTYYLHRDRSSHAVSSSALSVSDLGTKFQVSTGPLRFTVKKQGFNLFDEAWVDESGAGSFDDAHKIVSSHTKGFSLLSLGVRYYASNDNSSTAVIERHGPQSCVIRIDGRLKDASGVSKYFFRTRIYAYSGSKDVKVVFSFENRDPNVNNYVVQNGLNMELPLNLSSTEYALGAPTGTKSGTLASDQEAFLLVSKIDKYKFGGVLNDSGNSLADKSPDLGWALLKDGTKGVGVQTRWLWQMYPSSVEVNSTGMLNVGLFSHRFTGGSSAFPPRFANHYRIYSGMGRSHEMRFVFFNNSSNEHVRSTLIGANSRLVALAPASWYCRVTKAFGPLVERGNAELFAAPYELSRLTIYDNAMWNAALKCIGNTNAILGGKDAYDYLGWGDNPHYFESAGRLLWNGNYYDLPHLMLQNFARSIQSNESQSYYMLDYFHAHTTHIQDLHITHFEPNDMNDGACRYCPPTNHIGQDALEPVVMNHTSHHKTMSLFEMYYLLGEERALDAALKGVKWIKSYTTSEVSTYNITCYARRPGHIFNTLIAGYEYNFDPQCLSKLTSYLTPLRTTLGTGGVDMCGSISQAWMTGLLTEPMVKAAEITGNPLWAATVKQIVDSTLETNSNNAFAAAYCARQFNNGMYLDKAYSLFSSIGNGMSFGHHEKDYAEKCRSVLMAFAYFAKPESLNISAEVIASRNVKSSPMDIAVSPNPFSPELNVKISLPGAGKAKVSLFTLDGRVVRTFSEKYLEAGIHTLRLISNNSGGTRIPNGLYVVRLEALGKVLSKSVVHLK